MAFCRAAANSRWSAGEGFIFARRRKGFVPLTSSLSRAPKRNISRYRIDIAMWFQAAGVVGSGGGLLPELGSGLVVLEVVEVLQSHREPRTGGQRRHGQ